MPEFKPQIEFRDPQSLTPYHRNNKKHPTGQIDKLAGAIAEFDFDVPIVVDSKGVVIKGHGRREAAIRLGLKQVPIIVRSDLSAAQIKAARIADNRIAEEGKTDYEALALELEDIADIDEELLKFTGLDTAELARYLEESLTDHEFGERGQGGEGAGQKGEGEDDEDDAVAKSPAEKIPVPIVLTPMQSQQWEAFKMALGEKNDTKALLKIMELGVRLK